MAQIAIVSWAVQRIVTRDERWIAASPHRVFELVSDFTRYPSFWPADSRFTVERALPGAVGSRARCHLPGRRGSFLWLLTAVEPEALVSVEHQGLFVGAARWTLAPEAGGTLTGFEVDLRITPLLVRLLARVMDMTLAHSKFMQRVLAGLDRQAAPAAAASTQGS